MSLLGKKVFTLDLYFVLPDSFNGTTDDAIREFLKYREEGHPKQETDDITEVEDIEEMKELMWDLFVTEFEQNNRKASYLTGIHQLTEFPNTWLNIEKGVNK